MNEYSEKYIRPKEASQLLKVSQNTLRSWDNQGLIKSIRTKGKQRRFLLSSILSKNSNSEEKRKICYCRVSSHGQKEDLERQVKFFQIKFPDYEIIKDIGSAINFKRKGLNSILESAINGNIQEVVVTHKDRLCRFGFELFQKIIEEHSNGKILVLNQEETSPNQELVDDLLSIITVFSSRIYGLRSHSIKNKIKEASKELQNSENKIVPQ